MELHFFGGMVALKCSYGFHNPVEFLHRGTVSAVSVQLLNVFTPFDISRELSFLLKLHCLSCPVMVGRIEYLDSR